MNIEYCEDTSRVRMVTFLRNFEYSVVDEVSYKTGVCVLGSVGIYSYFQIGYVQLA